MTPRVIFTKEALCPRSGQRLIVATSSTEERTLVWCSDQDFEENHRVAAETLAAAMQYPPPRRALGTHSHLLWVTER